MSAVVLRLELGLSECRIKRNTTFYNNLKSVLIETNYITLMVQFHLTKISPSIFRVVFSKADELSNQNVACGILTAVRVIRYLTVPRASTLEGKLAFFCNYKGYSRATDLSQQKSQRRGLLTKSSVASREQTCCN